MYAEATYLNARGKNEFLRKERYLKPKPSFSWPPLALISSLPLVQCRPKINVYDTVLHDMYWGKSRIFQTDTVLLNKYLLRQMFIQMNCVKARCSRLTSLTFLLLKRPTRIYLSNDHRVSLHLITFTRRVRMVLSVQFPNCRTEWMCRRVFISFPLYLHYNIEFLSSSECYYRNSDFSRPTRFRSGRGDV